MTGASKWPEKVKMTFENDPTYGSGKAEFYFEAMKLHLNQRPPFFLQRTETSSP